MKSYKTKKPSNLNFGDLQNDWELFLSLIKSEKHITTIRIAIVDMLNGDHLAAMLLSQILFWHLPDKEGNATKLRVEKKGHFWLAKQRSEWWETLRMTTKQVDRAIKKIKEGGISR